MSKLTQSHRDGLFYIECDCGYSNITDEATSCFNCDGPLDLAVWKRKTLLNIIIVSNRNSRWLPYKKRLQSILRLLRETK